MRNVSFLPVTFLFLASPGLAQVDVEYDADVGITTISVPAVGGSRDAFSVKASFECSGDRVCVPDGVQMIFAVMSRRPRYRTNHDVILVLNKDKELRDIRTRQMETTAPSMYRGIYEFVVCDTPTEEFLSIASAKKVDYQVGSTKGKLSKEQLAALAKLAERIEAATEG